MKTIILAFLLSNLIFARLAIQVRAQDSDARPPGEWTERYDRMFLERAPLLNDHAPDVTAFDQHGTPFKLSSTRGQYTVLVFGCLT